MANEPPPLTAEEFAETTLVSRETLERLQTYLELLQRWQPKINLVGQSTLIDPWRRHMLDSAQLHPFLNTGTVLDIGSGAGFPGLVLAILASGGGPVHLVESDQRKGAFLREVIRVTNAAAILHSARIETIAPFPVANVTARAVAPLTILLGWAAPFLEPKSQCLFLKGAAAEDELTEASESWMMTTERFPSCSDERGIIFKIRGLSDSRKQR